MKPDHTTANTDAFKGHNKNCFAFIFPSCHGCQSKAHVGIVCEYADELESPRGDIT